MILREDQRKMISIRTLTSREIFTWTDELIRFLEESNLIEGIVPPVPHREVKAAQSFLKLERLTVEDVSKLVDVFRPGAKLRDKPGMDVRVGDHLPMRGGPDVPYWLKLQILGDASKSNPHVTRFLYEKLHPFTDGNGRSGRMIWLWQMKQQGKLDYALKLGFLECWYRQSLSEGR